MRQSRRELEQRLDAELADEGGLADWLRAEIRSGEWERRQRRNYQNILPDRARLAQLKREGYTFDSERRLVAPALTRIHVAERRENAARPRERRVRRSSATGSRGDPDPEPEPPLRVIPLAAFRRELRRALGVSP
jgi:hypothetical protein